jgi:hypothetical protein
MEQTVKQVAEQHGTELAIKWADHRTECLESEVRRLRQALLELAKSAIAGDPRTAVLAEMSITVLNTDR